jgi:hypothetical protein
MWVGTSQPPPVQQTPVQAALVQVLTRARVRPRSASLSPSQQPHPDCNRCTRSGRPQLLLVLPECARAADGVAVCMLCCCWWPVQGISPLGCLPHCSAASHGACPTHIPCSVVAPTAHPHGWFGGWQQPPAGRPTTLGGSPRCTRVFRCKAAARLCHNFQAFVRWRGPRAQGVGLSSRLGVGLPPLVLRQALAGSRLAVCGWLLPSGGVVCCSSCRHLRLGCDTCTAAQLWRGLG